MKAAHYAEVLLSLNWESLQRRKRHLERMHAQSTLQEARRMAALQSVIEAIARFEQNSAPRPSICDGRGMTEEQLASVYRLMRGSVPAR